MKKIIAAVFLAFGSSPAWADDWALSCEYAKGVAVEITYDAGTPSHSIAVRRAGSSGLRVTELVPAARLTAEGAYTFIVDRDRTGEPNEHNLIIRLNTETMASVLEAGNGVSWDYVRLDGKCVEQ